MFDFGLSPYASISSSFQPTIGVDSPATRCSRRAARSTKIGIKYQPDNGNVSATAAAYKIIQQNALTPDPAHPGFNLQSGQVTVQGLEFDVTASLARGLNLIGSYTYTDAKITQSNGADLGSQVATVPQHVASLWSDYRSRRGGSAASVSAPASATSATPTAMHPTPCSFRATGCSTRC